MLKKIVKIVLILLLISIPVFADIDYEAEYNSLLDDYETLLNDYDQCVDDLKDANNNYKNEIGMHLISKDQIERDQREIKMLREDLEDLLVLIDPRYFTIYLMGGQAPENFTGELAFSIDVPKVPISAIVSAQYTINEDFVVKLGIGIKF